MLRTISIGNHISVQGLFVSQGPDGKIAVSVDNRVYVGTPVQPVRQS
ncbi:hypothetical protein [Pseudogemmobacter humi]|uniref:Uncharacterized protein n=1 Tax=Pseudogemmobacter humi TaxID=2483812 RepID=A0A3P5WYU5_9RHOB|nr:hypothetical protein [Pseudogemmobacter humi]VDC23506.1 hypothetical protein XINFAN_01079 [Pseudogemmobacter humi]